MSGVGLNGVAVGLALGLNVTGADVIVLGGDGALNSAGAGEDFFCIPVVLY